MNSAKKLTVPILLAVTIVCAIFLMHSPNNQDLLTQRTLGFSTYAYESTHFDERQETTSASTSEKLLINGPWRTPQEFSRDNHGAQNLSSRLEVNKILLDYWSSKHQEDEGSFFLGQNTQKYNDQDFVKYHDSEVGLEYWEPDWYKNPNLRELLTQRMQNIISRCDSFNGVRNVWKRRIAVRIPKIPALNYCCHAKAGSTFWRRVLKALRQNEKATLLKSGFTLNFTTIRNPWHRLVSTYLEKFSSFSWIKERHHFCPPYSIKSQPTFRTFVQDCVLANWRKGVHNIHTMPGLERCRMCEGSFNYAIAVENMMPEGAFMLSTMGVEDADKFLQGVRDSTIRKIEAKQVSKHYQEYYDSLDIRDIKQLQDIYAFEIYVLQYPHSPFVAFKKS